MKVRVALVPVQLPFSVGPLSPLRSATQEVGVGVGVLVKVAVGIGVVEVAGTLTRAMAAGARVTEKLAPVVKAAPEPGTAETAGLTVPLMEMLVSSWGGEVAPPLVWPAGTRFQMDPAVPGEKPERETVATCWLEKSLLARKTVRLPAASLDAQERTVAAPEVQATRLRPKALESRGYR